MTTTVVNLHREEYDVYIGRGSIWGNPFRIGPDGNRAEVIRKYELWLLEQPELLKKIPTLQDQRLGCFCKPAPCHGDILSRLADLQGEELF